eukprot:SAG31_NODE_7300_length_1727_cov_1.025184_3_plen_267_part_00
MKPESGSVVFFDRPAAVGLASPSEPASAAATVLPSGFGVEGEHVLAGIAAALLATAVAAERQGARVITVATTGLAILLLSGAWILRRRKQAHDQTVGKGTATRSTKREVSPDAEELRKLHVVFITSEDNPANDLDQKATIEEAIGELMYLRPPVGSPGSSRLPLQPLTKAERRIEVVSLLRRGGFQMYDQDSGKPVGDAESYCRDGIKVGTCSGGQKHLVYVLRMLASVCFSGGRPTVVVCDELLSSLDGERQARVVNLLAELTQE